MKTEIKNVLEKAINATKNTMDQKIHTDTVGGFLVVEVSKVLFTCTASVLAYEATKLVQKIDQQKAEQDQKENSEKASA